LHRLRLRIRQPSDQADDRTDELVQRRERELGLRLDAEGAKDSEPLCRLHSLLE
jgi:hypothetical protein